MTGTFYDNKGSNVTDHFSIVKEVNGKKANLIQGQEYLPQFQ
jgi:hypothetical protein